MTQPKPKRKQQYIYIYQTERDGNPLVDVSRRGATLFRRFRYVSWHTRAQWVTAAIHRLWCAPTTPSLT